MTKNLSVVAIAFSKLLYKFYYILFIVLYTFYHARILEMLLPPLTNHSYLSSLHRRENKKTVSDLRNAIATPAKNPTLIWYGIRGFGDTS